MTSDLRGVRSGVWNISELLSLLATEYAAALMRVTLGGFLGFTGGTGSRIPRAGSRISARGVNDGSVSMEVSSWIQAVMVARNYVPNTQSIQRIVAGEPVVS